MNIESRLADLIGAAAGRLHTARSRNDQVAVDFRLYVRATIDALDEQIRALQQTLAEKALAYAGAVMPGFTHLQSAQPVTFGHHLLAYVEMLARDRGRFHDARARLLTTAPGVGSIVALTYASAIDDPGRFKSSKTVGALFGLTPKKYQSGETDVTGRISKIGDAAVRTALYEAANIILERPVKGGWLKEWALGVAKRAGMRKAKVALARKLAVTC